MSRRAFCKIAMIAVVVSGLLAPSGVLFAQGRSEEALDRVIEIQERHTDAMMARPGVVGTAVGLNASGRYSVIVLLEKAGNPGIPEVLENIPVKVKVTGEIHALSTTDVLPRPVPIGVSTGNIGECSAGTIGCRVTDGTNVYALSNNHVYALENAASYGSIVLQPGRYDAVPQCAIYVADEIGRLTDFEPIVFSRSASNEIDAAIALSSVDSLGNTTLASGYGTPNSNIVGAVVGQLVQKFGRTTELTHGQVTGINATVKISYGFLKTARFVKQIIIEPGGFSDSGDSGSLIVTDDGNRNPVGLLFAGSSSVTIANRIDLVLARFGVTIDGSAGSAPLTITTTSLPDATVDTAYSATLTASGGILPYTWEITAGSLPSGLNLNLNTGEISGTPTTAGTQGFTVQVTDNASAMDTQYLSITVRALSEEPTTVSVASITYATSGGKDGKKHLSVTVALKDDLNNPVAGASVSVRLDNTTTRQYWTATGTTGTGGTVTFTLSNAPSGTYTTTVTGVVAAGLTWDTLTPPNSLTK